MVTDRLSNRAAAELELILAEDPMCGGKTLEPSPKNVEKLQELPAVESPKVVKDVKELKLPPSGSKLQDFDGLHLKLDTLELTALGRRKLRDAESVWLRCCIALGDRNAEEIHIRCPDSNGNPLVLQHSSSLQKPKSAEWQEVASQPLQLGLLVGAAEKSKVRAPRTKGSQALSPVAQAELLWFAALLEPGKASSLTADLKAVEPTGTKSTIFGRLHFSVELTEAGGISPASLSDASGIYLRVWLDVLHADLAGARAILKLGPAQEVAVPVQPLLDGVGRLGQSAISSSPIWKTKDGICVAGPSPPCIFVQIWQGAELCGLAKLVLSPLTPESGENINLRGYEQILQEDVDVLAVSTNRSIGKLRVLLHAGLEPILEALQEPPPSQLPKARNQIVTEAAAGMMTMCSLSLEALQLLESDLKRRMSSETVQKVQKGETRDVETAEQTDGSDGREVDAATLRAYQPLLTAEEADSLALWLSETSEGSVWSTLMSRIHMVNESFDQLIKEVGDECTSVALDFLDVAAPSKLQRQDIARVLRFRGIELGWNTLERIFMALGCSKYEKNSSHEPHVLPMALEASSFSRLFKSRAERRMLEVAGLRQLEAKVLAWWRWRDRRDSSPGKAGNGQVKQVKPASTVSAADLVSGFSKSDGTVDLMGLKVLLASMNGPFQQDEVENLAQWLFEGFGARPGGGVPKDLVLQWLTGDGQIFEKMHNENNQDVAKEAKSQETPRVPAVPVASAKVEEQLEQVHLSSPKNPARIPFLQDARNPSPTHGNPYGSEKVPVSQASQVSQATIQLSKPFEGRHGERLTEVLSTSLQHPLHQIKVSKIHHLRFWLVHWACTSAKYREQDRVDRRHANGHRLK
eukprot:s94_g60.t2